MPRSRAATRARPAPARAGRGEPERGSRCGAQPGLERAPEAHAPDEARTGVVQIVGGVHAQVVLRGADAEAAVGGDVLVLDVPLVIGRLPRAAGVDERDRVQTALEELALERPQADGVLGLAEQQLVTAIDAEWM